MSGSGLSAAAGLATFSTPGGLYDRAARAARLPDGKALFTHAFYARRRHDALGFLADVHDEVAGARPTRAHAAVAALARSGRLRRHYTLNVDGLAAVAGETTWHPDLAPDGTTVELHGNARHAVCPACDAAFPTPPAVLAAWRARADAPCPSCTAPLRPRVMLYEDAEGDAITHPSALDALEEDVAAADAVVWVGLSFEQSATTAYFRRARAAAAAAGRAEATLVAIVNPADDALFNLVSASANAAGLAGLLDVRGTADDVLVALAAAMGVTAEAAVKAEDAKGEAAAAAVAAPPPPPLASPPPAAADLFPPAVANYDADARPASTGDRGEEAEEEEADAAPLSAPPPPPAPWTLSASPG